MFALVCWHYLVAQIFYPADMPLPLVRLPLGLPLGDRGLLPLPYAFRGVGTGVVARGPYTLPILKGYLLPVPGCPTRRMPTGAGHKYK